MNKLLLVALLILNISFNDAIEDLTQAKMIAQMFDPQIREAILLTNDRKRDTEMNRPSSYITSILFGFIIILVRYIISNIFNIKY